MEKATSQVETASVWDILGWIVTIIRFIVLLLGGSA